MDSCTILKSSRLTASTSGSSKSNCCHSLGKSLPIAKGSLGGCQKIDSELCPPAHEDIPINGWSYFFGLCVELDEGAYQQVQVPFEDAYKKELCPIEPSQIVLEGSLSRHIKEQGST